MDSEYREVISIEGKLKLYNFFYTFVPIVCKISVCLINYLLINPATSFSKNYEDKFLFFIFAVNFSFYFYGFYFVCDFVILNISGISGCSNGSYVFTYIYSAYILFEDFYYFELVFCISIGYFYDFVGDYGYVCTFDLFYGGVGMGIFNPPGGGGGGGGNWIFRFVFTGDIRVFGDVGELSKFV